MGKTGSQRPGKESEKLLLKSAVNKAMAACARREYCRSDMLSKLESWGLDEKDAESVINSLLSENFINETRFAEAFVRDKYNQNKWGRVKIAAHLRGKKINSGIISQALGLIDEDQYRQMITNTLKSHRKSVKAKNRFDLKGRLLRFGLSRGYESHIIYDILNEPEL